MIWKYTRPNTHDRPKKRPKAECSENLAAASKQQILQTNHRITPVDGTIHNGSVSTKIMEALTS
jgi:hypothetical protein